MKQLIHFSSQRSCVPIRRAESILSSSFHKWTRTGLTFLFILLASNSHASSDLPLGYLDGVEVSPGKILLEGWFGESADDRLVSVEVFVGSHYAFNERVSRYERPDVPRVTGRADWLNAGWRAEGSLPSSFKRGKYRLRAVALCQSGREVVLNASSDKASAVVIGSGRLWNKIHDQFYSTIVFLIILVAVSGVLFARFIADLLCRLSRRTIREEHVPILSLSIAFCGLVSLGISGSSIEQGLLISSGLVETDYQPVAGSSRAIRSDEWKVFTPMAIAQFNHDPRFPVHNHNLGSDGQNMLIIGMTGVPVAHISSLAKPATWGFFVFDLRRALAWYWWFPVFGCLGAVWWSMGVLAPGRWRFNLAVALLLTTSAYAVAWSHWPGYVVFFPALAYCLFISILNAASWVKAVLFGFVLGLSLAGFVMVLYPPWQISVGYMFLFLTVGTVVHKRLWTKFKITCAIAIVLSVAVAGFLCWTWLQDAKQAIAMMQATVYPGQRSTSTGGNMMLWEFFRGFLNSRSLYYESATITNQCESASFFYFFPPVVFAVVLKRFKTKTIHWPECALIAFCFLMVWFQIIGISPAAAKISFLGHVTDRRTDLALGLGSIYLCGLFLVHPREIAAFGLGEKIAIVGVSLAWASLVIYAVMSTPEAAIGKISAPSLFVLFSLVFLLSLLLVGSKYKSFLLLSLFISLAISISFNPLIAAPKKVAMNKEMELESKRSTGPVLVIGSNAPAMALFSAGHPVSNGVFYYPQKTIWKALDPDGAKASITNRYQHLIFIPERFEGSEKYRIDSPYPDIVRVVFDPAIFDFRLTGAFHVLAPGTCHGEMSKNPKLRFLKRIAGMNLYGVI